MESAFFYNTFFAVPVPKKDILVAIQSMPDDVANLIGTFFNAKEMVGMERMNRLSALQEKFKTRTENDWIQAWEKGKAHFLPTLIKVCPKTIKYNYCWGEKDSLNRKDLCKFAIGYTRPIDSFIEKCIIWSRPKPIHQGQRYTDISGKYLVAEWLRHKDEHWTSFRYNDGTDQQGCERKELRWVKY
jgi:hypothetical protein